MHSVSELETLIGESVKKLRLLRNINLQSVAKAAGVSVNALRHLEAGSGVSLKTFIKVLKFFKKEDWIKSISPIISINPLDKTLNRKRASKIIVKTKTVESKKQLLKTYNLTVDDFVSMFRLQNGECGNPGCNVKLDILSKDTHIDHDHTTGKVRSILCRECNLALGILKEDISKLDGLKEYLKNHCEVK